MITIFKHGPYDDDYDDDDSYPSEDEILDWMFPDEDAREEYDEDGIDYGLRAIIKCKKIKSTDLKYPRLYSQIKKKSL